MSRAEEIMESCPCHEGDGEYVGRLTSGDLSGGPHASAYVCERPSHRGAAEEWCRDHTGIVPTFHPFARPLTAQPCLPGMAS